MLQMILRNSPSHLWANSQPNSTPSDLIPSDPIRSTPMRSNPMAPVWTLQPSLIYNPVAHFLASRSPAGCARSLCSADRPSQCGIISMHGIRNVVDCCFRVSAKPGCSLLVGGRWLGFGSGRGRLQARPPNTNKQWTDDGANGERKRGRTNPAKSFA